MSGGQDSEEAGRWQEVSSIFLVVQSRAPTGHVIGDSGSMWVEEYGIRLRQLIEMRPLSDWSIC
jgi:hypothetical protein